MFPLPALPRISSLSLFIVSVLCLHVATLADVFWSAVVCKVDEDAEQTIMAHPMPSFDDPFRPHLQSHKTYAQPFSFDSRTQEMFQRREQRINAMLEQEEKVEAVSLCIPLPVVSTLSFSFSICFPFPSNRQHLSCGDCLEGKRGDYLTSSVLLCIIIVHIICTPI